MRVSTLVHFTVILFIVVIVVNIAISGSMSASASSLVFKVYFIFENASSIGFRSGE